MENSYHLKYGLASLIFCRKIFTLTDTENKVMVTKGNGVEK